MKQKTEVNDVAIGVDVTKEGTHVVAMRLRPDGKNVVIYSQFHLLVLPPRKPLTDEEIASIYMSHTDRPMHARWDFARAIEAAHGIK